MGIISFIFFILYLSNLKLKFWNIGNHTAKNIRFCCPLHYKYHQMTRLHCTPLFFIFLIRVPIIIHTPAIKRANSAHIPVSWVQWNACWFISIIKACMCTHSRTRPFPVPLVVHFTDNSFIRKWYTLNFCIKGTHTYRALVYKI